MPEFVQESDTGGKYWRVDNRNAHADNIDEPAIQGNLRCVQGALPNAARESESLAPPDSMEQPRDNEQHSKELDKRSRPER